jgi:hypothetical protein
MWWDDSDDPNQPEFLCETGLCQVINLKHLVWDVMGRQHCPDEVEYVPCETGFCGGRLLALARAIERLVARNTSPKERRRMRGLCCTPRNWSSTLAALVTFLFLANSKHIMHQTCNYIFSCASLWVWFFCVFLLVRWTILECRSWRISVSSSECKCPRDVTQSVRANQHPRRKNSSIFLFPCFFGLAFSRRLIPFSLVRVYACKRLGVLFALLYAFRVSQCW